MKTKSYLKGISFLLIFTITEAQQDYQMSMQFLNYSAINPGALGAERNLCGTLMGRTQWVGFDGHPQTFVLGVHSFFPQIWGGVGLNLFYDKLGLESSISAKIGYAFRYQLGPGNIGIGFYVGILNKSLKNDWIAKDPVAQDVLIPDVSVSKSAMDFDVGIHYTMEKIFLGISATHLTTPKLSKDLSSSNMVPDIFQYNMARHYYFFGGYLFDFAEMALKLIPSILIKTDGVITQGDVNVRGIFKETFWGGISFRFQDAIIAMLGISYPVWKGNLLAGYSYDFNISRLRKYNSGSHEIGVKYCLPILKGPEVGKHKTVRYL